MYNEKFDLTGQRFGSLTVIKQDKSGTRGRKWLCRCDCGKEIVIYGYRLKEGQRKSCGCRQHEWFEPRPVIDTNLDDAFLNLRIAIINQAVSDWRYGNKEKKQSLEKWFLSDWGQFISGDMGEIIIEKLRKGKSK